MILMNENGKDGVRLCDVPHDTGPKAALQPNEPRSRYNLMTYVTNNVTNLKLRVSNDS